MNATKYVTTKDITIPAGTILGEAPPKTVRAVPFVSALIPHGVDATSEWVMPMDEALEYGLIIEFSQEPAALSAHGQPVVDERINRAWKLVERWEQPTIDGDTLTKEERLRNMGFAAMLRAALGDTP